MKDKKWIWITLSVSLLIILFVIIGIVVFKNTRDELSLYDKEIANLKTSNTEIPRFTIIVDGLYNGTITNLDLEEKKIQVYEFDAGIYNGWEVKTNHYTGVRLKDVLKAMNITEYSEIEFKGIGEVSVTFKLDEISDKTYLMFYRDGKKLNDDEPAVNLLTVDYQYRYSIQCLQFMTIK